MNTNLSFAPVRVNPVLLHAAEQRLSLNSKWRFRLDPDDRGIKERWYKNQKILTKPIQVPGCWQGQGFGGDGNDKLWDFQLEARTYRATYKGTGWYGRKFRVPSDWKNKRICLNFGGVHPSAEVWLNGTRLGENHAAFVPFGFDITPAVRPDGENWLAVRVHEEDRLLGLSLSWQGNWSGLYRGVELAATGDVFLRQVNIYPDVDRQLARCQVEMGGGKTANGSVRLHFRIQAIGGQSVPIQTEVEVADATVETEIPVPSPRRWSPDSPNLYRVDVALLRGKETLDAQSERIGFVKLSTEGKRFLINGEPYYLRGTGDFQEHPETGCPDTDRDRWRKKLKTLRAYGYNYVRCQSYVPACEYFDVADEVGLLVQSEMGVLGAWGGQTPWHVYAWPPPTPSYREALWSQWNQVVRRDVNHPSANLYCMSNELPITDYPKTAWQCYRETKAIKPTAFVIWTDGGYRHDLPGDFVNADGNFSEKCGKPVIQHEFRWWSSFPDVRINHKFTGAMRHYGAEIARAAAVRQGLAHLLPEFAEKSQQLQFLEAKAKMENCRRDFPKLAGICHFDAMDHNPSPQGILDHFYERKVADAPTWLQTNGDTVILSSLGFNDRVLESGSEFKCKFFVSDFAHPPLKASAMAWRLMAGRKKLAEGSLAYSHQSYGTHPVGEISVTIPAVRVPTPARLEATLRDGKRYVANSWKLWLFPCEAAKPSGVARYGDPRWAWAGEWGKTLMVEIKDLAHARQRVVLTDRLDDPLLDFMRGGGRVILAAGEGLVRPHRGNGCGGQGYFFTPGANYGPYEDGQNGTLIRDHAMLGDFPHEGFADFQFYRLMQEAPPIELKPLGLADGEPAIRVIPRYPVGYSLAYLVERSLGKGGIILTSLQLSTPIPEARRLLANLVAYAESDRFHPRHRLSDETIARVVAATNLKAPEGFFNPLVDRFSLPAGWRVFGPVEREHTRPSEKELAAVPNHLTIDGRRLTANRVESTEGRFDLAGILGGTQPGKAAYVYIPFETDRPLRLRLGFGADWWFEAFLDGAPFLDSLATGNGNHPPRATDFTKVTDLTKGSHLLAIRFISGSGGSVLHVGAWHA